MPKRNRPFLALCFVAGVLVWCSTRAVSRYEGDTTGEPGPSSDACASKSNYETAKADADAAEAHYRKLAEPDWDKLYYSSGGGETDLWTRDESSLGKFLHELKTELAQARQKAATAGNPDPQQAEKNFQNAKKHYDDLVRTEKTLRPQIANLEFEIKNLMVDVSQIDAKLAATTPSPKPSSNDDQKLQADIKKYEALVSANLSQIKNLTGTDDVDEARRRVADKGFRKFSSPGITSKQLLYDRAVTPDELQAAQGALDREIENARQAAGGAITDYSAASRKLSNLQSQANAAGTSNGAGSSDDSAQTALRSQKAAKQKQIQDKVAQKAQLGLKMPTQTDLSVAQKRVNAAEALKKIAVEPRELADDVRAVEPWIQARIKNTAAQGRLERAKADYANALKVKDATLEKVRNDFNALQTWMNGQRASLQGREHDEAYWQAVSQMKNRAQADYTAMIAELSGLECFPDVKDLLTDIRARLQKVRAIKIGTPVKKPPTVVKNSGANIAGWWVWLRPKEKGGVDRIPMILEYHQDDNSYRGVYFPGITTQNIVRGRGPTVQIGFVPISGNQFRYRYKYPNSSSGGGRGGGVMTLSGNRLSGGWADDEGGASGKWTLERATAAERALLKSKIGGRG
jgi:archaellum component FlaC